MTLRSKILLVAATLVLLSQTGTVAVILFIAHRDVSERAELSLQTGATVIQRATTSRARQFDNTVKALAGDYGFKQAIGVGDKATIHSALLNHARRAETDIAFLIDTQGQLLATTLRPDGVPDKAAPAFDLPANPSAGRRTIVIGDTAYEVFTVPVRAPLPIAWLSMGIRLDKDFTFLLRDLTGLEVSIIDVTQHRPRVLATTLGGPDKVPLVNAMAAGVPKNQPTTLMLANEQSLALRATLLGDTDGVNVVLTRSLAEAMASFNLLVTGSFFLGALPLLAAMCGAVLLSQALTAPMGRLKQAALRIKQGDYSTPVTIQSSDELRQFGDAFNAMQTEIAAREERISYQATHDSVSGLHNGNYAVPELQRRLDRVSGSGQQLPVLMLKLNAYEEISESLGRDIAERFLRQTARQLESIAGNDPLLARLEHDTFLIACNAVEDRDAAIRAAKQVSRQLGTAIQLPDIEITVNPSIGIALYPEHAREAKHLLLRANIAMSHASSKHEQLRIYEEGEEEKRVRNLSLLQDIAHAAANDELCLYFQPKISLADGRVCGMEALVRWRHPVHGLISPAEFIPILEQSGNITIVTRWVLKQSAIQYQRWRASGLDIHIAINFSAHDLMEKSLLLFIMDVLREHAVPPDRLVIEITEEAMVDDFSAAQSMLERIRGLGIRIAIDDFGTGYSSLSQLKRLPIDELKIDRAFIMQLPEEKADIAIVSSTIQMAHDLGLRIVAEGVGNGAASDWLSAKGVDFAQGFYWSPPMPADEVFDWMSNFSGGATQAVEKLRLI